MIIVTHKKFISSTVVVEFLQMLPKNNSLFQDLIEDNC